MATEPMMSISSLTLTDVHIPVNSSLHLCQAGVWLSMKWGFYWVSLTYEISRIHWRLMARLTRLSYFNIWLYYLWSWSYLGAGWPWPFHCWRVNCKVKEWDERKSVRQWPMKIELYSTCKLRTTRCPHRTSSFCNSFGAGSNGVWDSVIKEVTIYYLPNGVWDYICQ